MEGMHVSQERADRALDPELASFSLANGLDSTSLVASTTASVHEHSDDTLASPSLPDSADTNHEISTSPQTTKPKQRRNKPTLSCLECVERKTKCDRGRPCLACVKRQSTCNYTAVANLIASADRSKNGIKKPVTKPPSKIKASAIASALTSPTKIDNGWSNIDGRGHQRTLSSSGGSPFLFSNLPFSQFQNSPSNVFGIGVQHPFANYWTCQGGLPEVISVLPSKDQADLLIAKYFECVDPVYPFLHRRSVYNDYENFWAKSTAEKGGTDASLIALHYAMYALGTQFMTFGSRDEQAGTAEFYCSAANQALRVYSYLNRTSLRAIQAMLLMTYFLMNDNHASDAYAWAGIHLRQAYAMRLHRDPEIVVPEASVLEKQQRRKLWQAIFFQDTFLTVLLKLPPTATHSDVPVESLSDENELSIDGLDDCLGSHSRVENLMSISVIAPQICEPLAPPQPHHTVDEATMKSDVAYMRSMWHLGVLTQEHLSSPNSLSMPLANSTRHKDQIIAAFRKLYKSFPSQLTILEHDALEQRVEGQPRAIRQNLFLVSNYYHCLMLLQASENEAAGVQSNVKAALEAAHEALCAFFKLWNLFDVEAGVWWVFQHRAFEESILIANLLSTHQPNATTSDPIFAKVKDDLQHMLGIMERYGGNIQMHAARKRVLHELFEQIMA